MSKRPKTLFENTTWWTVLSRTPRGKTRPSAPSTMRKSSTTGEQCVTTERSRRPSSSKTMRPGRGAAPRNLRRLSSRNSVSVKCALVGKSLFSFYLGFYRLPHLFLRYDIILQHHNMLVRCIKWIDSKLVGRPFVAQVTVI